MDIIFDDRVSFTGNVLASIGVLLTLSNNVPQLYLTWTQYLKKQHPVMGHFSPSAVFMRIIANLLWLIYANALRSVLLGISSSISLISAIILSVFKIIDIFYDRKEKTYIIKENPFH